MNLAMDEKNSITPENIQKVDKIVTEDPSLINGEIPDTMSVSDK